MKERKREKERDKERKRDGEKERRRERERQRERDRQTDRERQTERVAYGEGEREGGKKQRERRAKSCLLAMLLQLGETSRKSKKLYLPE